MPLRAILALLLALSLGLRSISATSGGTAGANGKSTLPLSTKRRGVRPSLLVVSTIDGAVSGYDAATGASLFSVRSDSPAIASWAREGQPEYVPTLDGALYQLNSKTGEAVSVDAHFIAASQPRADGSLARPTGEATTEAGAVVLTAQSTAALSVNLRTGAVVRSLTFAGDTLDAHGAAPGIRAGDDIVLLSRTTIGVRVVHASTAEELANASITHTNPSFLERGRCLLPGSAVGADAQYVASVSEDRTRIAVRDASGRVVWEKRIDSTVVEAHGMGSVAVSSAAKEVEGSRAALPGTNNKLLALTETARSAHDIVIANEGEHRYAVGLNAPHHSNAEPASEVVRGGGMVYRVRDPFRGRNSPVKIQMGPSDGVGIMFLFVVIICLMAGYALGRRPRRRSRRSETRRISTSTNRGVGVPSAPTDGLSFAGSEEEEYKDDSEEEGSLRNTGHLKLSQEKFRKKVRIRKGVTELNSDGSTKQDIVDDSLPVSSTESTGSRSSGGVITHRSLSGWMNVGCLHVSSKVLGVGSHGTVVYEGKMMPGDRKVAVKRLLRQFFESARKEISLLVQLDEASPHVVRYYAMEEDSEFIYLALELCSGTLAERVCALELPAPPQEYGKGPAPLVTTRALRQLIQGLADLHRVGVVHRDLKPQNVLISRSIGGSGCSDVKLADVGLALRLAANRSSYTAISNAGGGVGTTGWRAPEVLRGGRQTKAVDIFSAGCIVCFVLTGGKHPFGTQIFGRDGNIASNRTFLEPLENLDLPEAVDIVRKMIHPESTERPTAEAALAHPFFWTDAMKLSFLVDISDRLYDLRNELARYTEGLDRSARTMKTCNDWIILMDMDLLSSLGRGYEATASGLLRVIRNKKNHYSELSSDLQKLLGRLPKDEPNDGCVDSDENGLHAHNFLTYFTKRVPHLLMCVYMYALENPALIEQPHFTRYGLKVAARTETPTLHPMVRKLQLERRSSALEVNSISEEGKSGSNEGSSRAPRSEESDEPAGHVYERYLLVELQKMSRALPPALEERMDECGVYSAETGSRWTQRLATGVYEPFGDQSIVTDPSIVDSEDEEVVPPGFEPKQRFRPPIPRPSPGRPHQSPSLRPSAGRTMASPMMRARVSPSMRNGGASPVFAEPEPFSLNSNPQAPFASPSFRSISSVSARRARMALASKQSGNNAKATNDNANPEGGQRVIDFSQLRRR